VTQWSVVTNNGIGGQTLTVSQSHLGQPTQPPVLSGMENEYQPKFGDALQLGSKGRNG